jgi:hypothetical protein
MLAVLAESRVADAVMAMSIPPDDAASAVVSTSADATIVELRSEANDEVTRLTGERRLIARSDRPPAPRPPRTPIVCRITARRTGLDGLFLIFQLSMDRRGRQVHAETLTIRLPGLQPSSAVTERITAMRERVLRLEDVAGVRFGVRDAAMAVVNDSPARRLVQPGLFDRRIRRDAAPHPFSTRKDDSLRVDVRLLGAIHIINRSRR